MVAHSRKTTGPGSLRPIATKPVIPKSGAPGAVNSGSEGLNFRSLNLPVPVEVVGDGAEIPLSITLPSPTRFRRSVQKIQSLAITSINDRWQVDEEWWREHPISRRYYQVTTQDERRLTIFRDQLNGSWYWQKGG